MTTVETRDSEQHLGTKAGPTAFAVEMLSVDRRFGDELVLDNISLHVRQGEIFGLAGPSGSGKTTVVKLIVGLLEPSSGDARVGDVAPTQFGTRDKRALGYMPQSFSLYPTLTVIENCRFMASLYGVGWLARGKRIREVLQLLELWDVRGRLAQHLSGGMQRRLALAASILHRPSLLIVDEPTAGLDPVLRLRIWDHLRDLRAEGTTIILTTQYLEEAERCDQVAILAHGKVAATGSPKDLRAEAGLPDVMEVQLDGGNPRDAITEVRALRSVRALDWDGERRLVLWVDDLTGVRHEVESLLEAHGCPATVTNARQATFEEVFMRHTGQR
jgi:ABC-2 type transport system ATP-binding protein